MKSIQFTNNFWDAINPKKLSVLILLSFGLFSCETSDDSNQSITQTPIKKYYKTEDLMKIHNGSEKSWRFTQIIEKEEYKDDLGFPKTNCVSDDIYTFISSETYSGLEPVQITLGETLCFESFSDAESYEAKINYIPEIVNGEEVLKINFVFTFTTYETAQNISTTFGTSYTLTELTEDRMVFSTGSEFIENYPWAYVFEKVE
jgi:hypothetical protein